MGRQNVFIPGPNDQYIQTLVQKTAQPRSALTLTQHYSEGARWHHENVSCLQTHTSYKLQVTSYNNMHDVMSNRRMSDTCHSTVRSINEVG